MAQSACCAVCPAQAAPAAVVRRLARQPESGCATDCRESLVGRLPLEYREMFTATIRDVRDLLQEYTARDRGTGRRQDSA